MVVSEFARALYRVTGLRPVDPAFEKRRQKQQYELRVKRMDVEFDHSLQKTYEEAKRQGPLEGDPRRSRPRRVLGGGRRGLLRRRRPAGPAPNGADRPITTREALKSYDPGLYALVDETMAYKEHEDWRFRP